MKPGVSLISELMLLTEVVNALLLHQLKLVHLGLCSNKETLLMLISKLGHSIIMQETTYNLNVLEPKWLEVLIDLEIKQLPN